MKIVIDTNSIIAAMIKNSAARKILFHQEFQFISPDYTIIEIYKHKAEIIKKANVTYEEFDILVSLILERIAIMPKQEYEDFLEGAEDTISDVDDVPFIALSLATKNDGIWSDDRHFEKQDKIKVWKTKDLVDYIEDK